MAIKGLIIRCYYPPLNSSNLQNLNITAITDNVFSAKQYSFKQFPSILPCFYIVLITTDLEYLSEVEGTVQLMFCTYLFSYRIPTGNRVYGLVPEEIFILLFILTEIHTCDRENKVRDCVEER